MEPVNIIVSFLIACLVFYVLDLIAVRLLPVSFHQIVRIVLFVLFLFYLLQLLAGLTGIKIGTL